MIFFALSVILSSLLFVCFKWFDLQKVNLQVAIAGNYMGCILAGLIFRAYSPQAPGTYELPLTMTCITLGILFFVVLYGMGYASANIGVGISSASTKMSLVIPVLYAALALHEPFGWSGVLALVCALGAVVLMSWNPGETGGRKNMLIPFLVFIGAGIVDTAINLLRMETEKRQLNHATSVIFIFTGALCASLILILIKDKRLLKDRRSLAYGFLLGIPNYFSIYAMMRALGSGAFSSNGFYMVNNTGIILICFILGIILFREKINLPKVAGLLLSVISIYLVLYC
jgi:drug/metabolite transporter (DMT)-like permease